MQNKNSTARLVSHACLIAFSLFCVLMLAFAGIYYDGFGSSAVDSDNGFVWLTFESNLLMFGSWDPYCVIYGILSILQLGFGLCAVALSALSFVNKKYENKHKLIIVGGLISMTLYAAEGIVLKMVEFGSSYYDDFITVSYVPLIIGVLLVVGYNLSKKYLPGDAEGTEAEAEVAAPAAAQAQKSGISAENVPEMLARYKSLLDSGAITEEEYEAKKKELLGL